MATNGIPPKTQVSFSDNPRGIAIIAALWTMIAVSAIFLGFRLYTKIHRGRRLWWDDYFLVIAWVTMDSPTPEYSSSLTFGAQVSPRHQRLDLGSERPPRIRPSSQRRALSKSESHRPPEQRIRQLVTPFRGLQQDVVRLHIAPASQRPDKMVHLGHDCPFERHAPGRRTVLLDLVQPPGEDLGCDD